MKLMVRTFDGYNYWDNVVNAEKNPDFGFDDYELVYESARYIPEAWVPYDRFAKMVSEELGRPVDDDEVMDYSYDSEMVVYLDYANSFVQLWVADTRPVPPNAKLGPVQQEFPSRERFKSKSPKRKDLFSR